MDRKRKRPSSWLASIRAAEAAFTGEALVIKDVAVPASETSFRGAGDRVTAEVTPRRALIGPLPEAPVEISGETRRDPEARLSLGSAYFPPDSLRQVPYWDYAQAGDPQAVLVLMSEQPLVRVLDGPEDDLPEAVTAVHGWLQLPAGEQRPSILEELAQKPMNPVAYVAAFELLRANEADLGSLFARFVALPWRPGAAVRGLLADLYSLALRLSDSDLLSLAWQLLEGWAQETDPAALSGYLVWFDAHGQRTWYENGAMQESVLAQVARARAMSFSGEYGEQWQQQVDYYASVLISRFDEAGEN